MHPNEELLHRFYTAFKARDGKGMAACYAADVQFHDPVFMDLRAQEVGAMWRMLASGARASELKLEFHGVLADDNAGTARWEAWYHFSQTGRPVHNVITSHFELRGGLIARQVDSFGFWRWSRQALGPVGWLLGWSPIVKNKVRRMARARLDEFMATERARGATNGAARKHPAGKAGAKGKKKSAA